MNEKFSTNLQFYRRRMDLTQEQLAERLDVSRQSISKWEAGAAVLLTLLSLDVHVAISVVSMLAFVIAGIMVMICTGMGDEEFRKKNPVIQTFYTKEEIEASGRRFRVGMTSFTGLLFGSTLFIVGTYALPEPAFASRLLYWAIFALIFTVAIVGLQLTGMLHDRYNVDQYNKNNATKKNDFGNI